MLLELLNKKSAGVGHVSRIVICGSTCSSSGCHSFRSVILCLLPMSVGIGEGSLQAVHRGLDTGIVEDIFGIDADR